MIENTDPPSQFSYVTFRRSDGSSCEESMRSRKKYRLHFENVGSVRRQLEAIRSGTVSKYVINNLNIFML